MEYIYYLIYLIVTWFLLMFIYRFSTYHSYFSFMSLILLVYSIFIAYLLYLFNLHQFFIWHIVITLGLLIVNYRKQKKAAIIFRDNETHKLNPEVELSIEKTLRYHILSSIIYLVVFSFSYLYFYNSE